MTWGVGGSWGGFQGIMRRFLRDSDTGVFFRVFLTTKYGEKSFELFLYWKRFQGNFWGILGRSENPETRSAIAVY